MKILHIKIFFVLKIRLFVLKNPWFLHIKRRLLLGISIQGYSYRAQNVYSSLEYPLSVLLIFMVHNQYNWVINLVEVTKQRYFELHTSRYELFINNYIIHFKESDFQKKIASGQNYNQDFKRSEKSIKIGCSYKGHSLFYHG